MNGDIAEKLVTIAENQKKIYEAGKAAGGDTDAVYQQGVTDGKQAEYDRFWDAYQNSGKRTTWHYAFAGEGWTDELYNPKYPIRATGGYSMQNMYSGSLITDTKIPITDANGSFHSNMFSTATKLETIRKIIIGRADGLNFGNTNFASCIALKNITVEGVINGKANYTDPNFQWSPLTTESMKNIILCLRDYTGTENEYACTVKFSDACWVELDAEGATAPGNITWAEYVAAKSWNV